MRPLILLITFLVAGLCGPRAADVAPSGAALRPGTPLAAPADARLIAAHGGSLFALDGPLARVLPAGSSSWIEAGPWRASADSSAPLALASSAQGVFVVCAERVARLAWTETRYVLTEFPTLPTVARVAAAARARRRRRGAR